MGISSVDADESSVTGYREISGVAAQDWMLYSQDASKVAVVHTKTAIDSPPKGESIAVYSVDLNLQPAQVLFEDKTEGQVVTEFQWVGNKLLYAVTENNLKPLVDASTSNQQGVVPLGDYPGILKFKMWPESTDRKIGISNIRIFPPGNILSNEANDSLITFDNTQDISALWDPIHRRFFDAIFDQRFLRQYQVSTDTLHERIRLNLPMLPARWWGGRNKFVPLFVSEDGGHLISIVGNNTTLSPNTKPIRSSVVSVNLSDGNIKPLTSGSDANGLHLPQGSDPRFFAPGNPASVSSNQVVCQLSMINTIDAVTSRFGFFDLNGKLLKDVFLLDQDLKKTV